MNERKQYRRMGMVFFTVLIGVPLLLRGILGMWRPDGGNGGEPKFYLGPVLPLTAISGGETLDVERRITFDFQAYGEPEGSKFREDSAYISDTYFLTNPGDETVTVELAYPFVGSLIGKTTADPTLSQRGLSHLPQTRRLAAIDPARTVASADGWESFRDAMTANDFLAEALALAPEMEEPVVVYAVTDIRYDGPEELKYPELTMSYDTPGEGVQVWDYLLGSSRSEEDTGREHKGFQFLKRDWGLLIVQGGDLENISFQAYNDEKFPPDVTLDGVTYQLTRYEATFAQVLQNLAKRHSRIRPNTWDYEGILYAATLTRIADEGHYSFGKAHRNLYELFESALTETLILYEALTVTIAPGKTVELEVTFIQEPSTELSGFVDSADTYDMATRLGSNLDFTRLDASVTGEEFIRIVEQNFGFDPENGITQVQLDLGEERYYLRVTKK